MLVRDYQESDDVSVVALNKAALNDDELGFMEGPWNDDLLDIRSVYLEPGGAFLVGENTNEEERNPKVVAMGALLRVDEGIVDAKRLRVHPDCRGLGYGRQMMLALLDKAKAGGFSRVTLDTLEHQTAARKLFTSLGFVETGEDRFIDRFMDRRQLFLRLEL